MKTITISREFGSGGREIGERLAKELGYYYFDSEVIRMIAEKAGVKEEEAEKLLELQTRPSYSTVLSRLSNYDKYSRVLEAQTEVLLSITTKYNCVIVGRGAAYLTMNKDRFSIFIHASDEARLARCRKHAHEKISDEELLKLIKKADENKKRFHKQYSSYDWDDAKNYDLSIDSSNFNYERQIPALANYIKAYFGEDTD